MINEIVLSTYNLNHPSRLRIDLDNEIGNYEEWHGHKIGWVNCNDLISDETMAEIAKKGAISLVRFIGETKRKIRQKDQK